jgi:hypothetical protein
MIDGQRHRKGGITSIRHLEVDPRVVWSLKFGDFAEDFVGHNLDDYQESLSLCELDGDQVFHRHKGRWVDARYNNFIEAHCLKDNRHCFGTTVHSRQKTLDFDVNQLEVGRNSDSRQLGRQRDRLPKVTVIRIEAEGSSSIRSRR